MKWRHGLHHEQEKYKPTIFPAKSPIFTKIEAATEMWLLGSVVYRGGVDLQSEEAMV